MNEIFSKPTPGHEYTNAMGTFLIVAGVALFLAGRTQHGITELVLGIAILAFSLVVKAVESQMKSLFFTGVIVVGVTVAALYVSIRFAV